METTKEILTEGTNAVNKMLQTPDITPAEKLQYKVMKKNLDGMLSVISWLQNNIRQCKKAR